MKNSQNGFALSLILVLVALLLAGGGVYVWEKNKQASQTIPESATTVDWKKYSNTQYGFSFRYPKEWTVVEGQRPDSVTLYKNYRSGATVAYPNDGMRYDSRISMIIRTDLSNNVLDAPPGPEIISSDPIMIDGQTATRQVSRVLSDDRELTYKMNLKNNPDLMMIITIELPSKDGATLNELDFTTYNKLLDELMKTFVW